MSHQSRIRRIGWFAALAICTALYLMLHLRVHAVTSEVVRAERQIVALEQQKLLLETEFETRSNQLQLAAWDLVAVGRAAGHQESGHEHRDEAHRASISANDVPGARDKASTEVTATWDGSCGVQTTLMLVRFDRAAGRHRGGRR